MKITIHNEQEFGARLKWYGEGFFSTMRIQNGIIPLWKLHFERLKYCCKSIFERDLSIFEQDILNKLKHLPIEGSVRITIATDSNERKIAQVSFINLTLEIKIDDKKIENSPLKTVTRAGIKYPDWWDNKLKYNNYLPSILAKKQNEAEIIWIDSFGHLQEMSYANLFLGQGNKIFTPKLTTSIYAGLMRQNIINILKSQNTTVEEVDIHYESLAKYNFSFVCNSVFGLRFLEKIDDHNYDLTSVPDNIRMMQEVIFNETYRG
jgi:4-amino-4-deoxychorismate lyase